jgi:hypothetical protein
MTATATIEAVAWLRSATSTDLGLLGCGGTRITYGTPHSGILIGSTPVHTAPH